MTNLICFLSFTLALTVWYFARLRTIWETGIVDNTDFLYVVPDEIDVSSVALVVLWVAGEDILGAEADGLLSVAGDTEALTEYTSRCECICGCAVSLVVDWLNTARMAFSEVVLRGSEFTFEHHCFTWAELSCVLADSISDYADYVCLRPALEKVVALLYKA